MYTAWYSIRVKFDRTTYLIFVWKSNQSRSAYIQRHRCGDYRSRLECSSTSARAWTDNLMTRWIQCVWSNTRPHTHTHTPTGRSHWRLQQVGCGEPARRSDVCRCRRVWSHTTSSLQSRPQAIDGQAICPRCVVCGRTEYNRFRDGQCFSRLFYYQFLSLWSQKARRPNCG